MDTSKKLPKYSVIILDEWEDSHYWSKLGITLRQFFRKCRQLNLFMLCIIPNFFELPRGYAVSRSAFFIDVYFEEGFERGHFKFYSFPEKKNLFHRGKKEMNYGCVREDFKGEFYDGYVVGREEYLEKKRRDLEGTEELIKPHDVIKRVYLANFDWLLATGMSKGMIAKSFGISERTGQKWRAKEDEPFVSDRANGYINPPKKESDDVREEGAEGEEG